MLSCFKITNGFPLHLASLMFDVYSSGLPSSLDLQVDVFYQLWKLLKPLSLQIFIYSLSLPLTSFWDSSCAYIRPFYTIPQISNEGRGSKRWRGFRDLPVFHSQATCFLNSGASPSQPYNLAAHDFGHWGVLLALLSHSLCFGSSLAAMPPVCRLWRVATALHSVQPECLCFFQSSCSPQARLPRLRANVPGKFLSTLPTPLPHI